MAKKMNASKGNSGMAGMWMWWVIAAVVLLVIWMGCWMWRAHRVAACSTGQLQLVPGQQSGAAGTIYQSMALKNVSNRACAVGGFPTAFLYGSNGYATGSGAAVQAQPAPVTIILAPNELAHTTLGYPQAGNFDPGVCSEKSTSLRFFVPGAVASLDTPLAVAWCPGFSATALQPGS